MNVYKCKGCGTVYERPFEKKIRKIYKCKKCGKVVELQLIATETMKMTKEDREKFASGIRTANPAELLAVIAFVEGHKDRMDPADLKFIHSRMGRRAERLLRNVVENLSFEDKPATRGGDTWEIN